MKKKPAFEYNVPLRDAVRSYLHESGAVKCEAEFFRSQVHLLCYEAKSITEKAKETAAFGSYYFSTSPETYLGQIKSHQEYLEEHLYSLVKKWDKAWLREDMLFIEQVLNTCTRLHETLHAHVKRYGGWEAAENFQNSTKEYRQALENVAGFLECNGYCTLCTERILGKKSALTR